MGDGAIPSNDAPKIVITGTGRAGTTLLVQLLDALGMDTGVASGRLTPYTPGVRAGLECRVDDPDAPTVVKDMTLGFRMESMLQNENVRIGHVIIPTRRLDVASASRVRAAEYGRLPFRRGALTGTLRATNQERVLAGMQARIVDALREHGTPFTLIEFPRFATDADYLHAQLGFLLPEATVDDFRTALERCVRVDLIHEHPLTRRERWRARATTVWMVLVRYPIARVRRWWNPEAQEAKLRASVAASREREARAAAEEARRRQRQASEGAGDVS